MKKTISIIIGICVLSTPGFSQDMITLKKGDAISAKIIEVGQTQIKYKKFDNQNGPVYILEKSDLVNILYENGTKDTFSTEIAKADSIQTVPADIKVVSVPKPVPGNKFLIGFSFVFPTGVWPETALSNMGSTSFLKSQGHTVTSYGFGVLFLMKMTKNVSLFLDGNAYDYNILIGKKGEDIQTAWSLGEMADHYDEPGAPQQPYVHDLHSDVHFDMQATGFRLGVKYYLLNKKTRPWLGAGFGFYSWQANYFNENKDGTYGGDKGTASGLTYLAGIDFEPMPGLILTVFADVTSPAANYAVKGLFYPQWNQDYGNAPIMGTSRFGLSFAFNYGKKK